MSLLLTQLGGGTTYTDTGMGVLGLVGSGADVVQRVDAGTGVSVLVGSGADALERIDNGTSTGILVGSGADSVTWTDAGTGILVLVGSGEDEVIEGALAEVIEGPSTLLPMEKERKKPYFERMAELELSEEKKQQVARLRTVIVEAKRNDSNRDKQDAWQAKRRSDNLKKAQRVNRLRRRK